MRKIWNRLSSIGAKEDMHIIEIRTIRTVNAVSIVAIPLIIAAWMVRLSEGAIFNHLFYPTFLLSAFVPLTANFKGKYQLAKISQLLITTIFMSYVSIQNLKIGINNHPEVVLIGYAAVIVLIFDNWVQIVAYFINFIAYFSVVIFTMSLNQEPWVNLIPNGINSFAAFSIIILITSVYKRDYINSQSLLLHKNQVLEHQSKKISEQSEKLTALNEFKNQLFSIISHDMRGPLHSVNSYFQLMQKEKFSKEEFEQILPILSENIKKTSDLMENMLTWAKSQLKGQNIRIEHVNVKELVKQILSLLKPQIDNKSLIINMKIDNEDILKTDKNMLSLIIRNILANAIKFSNVSGRIEIDFIPNNETSMIRVSDNGVGMSTQDFSLLFSDQSKQRNGTMMEKGTGLGLKFCKAFVEKLNGELKIESERNVGTTLIVMLPHKKENPEAV